MTPAEIASRRRRRERAGRLAERAAAAWLWAKGYRILALRARTAAGEIDLIARKGDLIAFVEVKSRANLDAALNAVPPQAWSRIARAAELWCAQNPHCADLDWRYDLIAAIGLRPIKHVRDAWRPN